MTKTLICASPLHEGDRLIRLRSAAIEKRIEYRRAGDQGRERVRMLYVLCMNCMNGELAERDGEDLTEAMF